MKEESILESFKQYHNANWHDGDNTFDERTYAKSNGGDFDCSFVQDCYDHFEAGTASRQAEIDKLQKRIDDALDYVFGLYCTGDLDTEHLENILKGDSNE